MTTTLRIKGWRAQQATWPAEGRHILAQHDDARVVVYQAYRPEIAEYVVQHQRFGGPWSVDRMTWIKPNFLWMMYRCGWATKEGQERVLAVWLPRAVFEAEILAKAVHSSHVPEVYGDRAAWQAAVKRSHVRLQWDPDHGPRGNPLPRRAIQLGLRGGATRAYANEWVRRIEDITGFVAAQRANLQALDRLETPEERVLAVEDAGTRARLGLDG
ncbi:MAG: DUF4291 domain-containing protein [Nannocystaceae bacterium]